ncbi:Putative glycoside/cation symporter YagG [Halioglobus japonicus]|nr:Putative glycoside/cation symporter YagG [Halioglobus japonicus]
MQSLSAREKWTYAIGNMPFSVKDAAYVNFVVFYYTQVQGLSGTLTGLAMFIALSWDAISDPIVGSWSDNLRTRWGRRHPLLVAGGFPTALLFLALFAPPEGLGELGMFTWLLAVSLLLRTFLTIYYIPFSAMGAELSADYDERTVIAKARVTMGWLAGMLLPAIAFILFFPSQNGIDGRLVEANYWNYGVLSAVVAAAAALVCIVGTRTAIPRLPQASPGAVFSWIQPLGDLKLIFGNRNFRISMGATLAFGMCAGVYTTLGLYLGTYFWEFSTDQLAGFIAPTAIGTLLAFVFLNGLGRRFDKPTLLSAVSFGLAINVVWLIGARLLGLLPENGHALIYPLQLLNLGIAVMLIVALQALSISLWADILDEQQVATGRRQEGVVFAAGSFVSKATTGAGSLLAGIVIDLSGIAPGAVPGAVSQNVLQSLGWFTLVTIACLAMVAFLFFTRLKLSRADHARVVSQLAAQGQRADIE